MGKRRFSVRKRAYDGAFLRYECVPLSTLRPLEPGEIDGPVWVITGVFKTRREIFR